MTATPIPRTLALVQYGNMVLSAITEMPPGRRRVATRVVPGGDERAREAVYDAIRTDLAAGGRAFIICTLVKDSEYDQFAQLRAVESEYEKLKVSIG